MQLAYSAILLIRVRPHDTASHIQQMPTTFRHSAEQRLLNFVIFDGQIVWICIDLNICFQFGSILCTLIKFDAAVCNIGYYCGYMCRARATSVCTSCNLIFLGLLPTESRCWAIYLSEQTTAIPQKHHKYYSPQSKHVAQPTTRV